MTPTEKFRACGEALYGSTWQSELARDLGWSVGSGNVRKVARGQAGITDVTWRKIAALMEDKRRALAHLIPQADTENENFALIRSLLRGTPQEAGACLVGLGWYRLGVDLMHAGRAVEGAQRMYDALEMIAPTVAPEDATGWDTFLPQPVDPIKAKAVWEGLCADKAALADLQRQAREIADALDYGYDGQP